MKERRLSSSLSLYLDMLRLVAAFLVFLGHANSIFFHFEFRFLFSQAANAVAIFFVLSGFVIAYVVDQKENSLQTYATARLARIYSVSLLSILLTLGADLLGSAMGGPIYDNLDANLHFMHPHSWLSLGGCSIFLNQLWFTHIVYGSNNHFGLLGSRCGITFCSG